MVTAMPVWNIFCYKIPKDSYIDRVLKAFSTAWLNFTAFNRIIILNLH